MSLAAIIDFEDEAAFRAYDVDEAHQRTRRDVLAPIVETGELPDSGVVGLATRNKEQPASRGQLTGREP